MAGGVHRRKFCRASMVIGASRQHHSSSAQAAAAKTRPLLSCPLESQRVRLCQLTTDNGPLTTDMITRRQMLSRAGLGIGSLPLASLMSEQKLLGAESLSSPHFNPTAKSVIVLFMGGGVSHVDTFDPKPALSK